MKTMEVVSIVASIIAGLLLLLGIMGANGAPQEASAAAMAAALAIIPYTITATLQRREILKRAARELENASRHLD